MHQCNNATCKYCEGDTRNCTKCIDSRYGLHKRSNDFFECKRKTAEYVFILPLIVAMVTTVIWWLTIHNKVRILWRYDIKYGELPSWFLWSIINHYQSFAFMVLFNFFAFQQDQSVIVLFIYFSLMSYVQVSFPLSSGVAVTIYSVIDVFEIGLFYRIWAVYATIVVFSFISVIFINIEQMSDSLRGRIFANFIKHNFTFIAASSFVRNGYWFSIASVILVIPLCLKVLNKWMKAVVHGAPDDLVSSHPFFSNLKFTEYGFLWNMLLWIKRTISSILMWLAISISDNTVAITEIPSNIVNYLKVIVWLFIFLEGLWMLYIYRVFPYRLKSQNWIEVINQFFLIGAWVYFLINLHSSLDKIFERGLAIFMFPYSYVIFAIIWLVDKLIYQNFEGTKIKRKWFRSRRTNLSDNGYLVNLNSASMDLSMVSY